MGLRAICSILLVASFAVAESQDKRGAQDGSYVTQSPKAAYATATSSSSYATAKPAAYSSKIQTQTIVSPKNNYAIAQPVAYEQIQQQQPQHGVRIAYQQPAVYSKVPVAYAVPQQQYVYEPQVTYAQSDLKYVQPAGKIAAIPAGYKVGYAAPAAVTYAAAPAAHLAPQQYSHQPAHSPASSVSSFTFRNPHVSYSNLGLLSQVVGKAQSHSTAQPQHVAYIQAPVAQPVQYVSAGHPITYTSPSQYTQQAAPQYQYQAQAQAPQYQAAQYQAAPQQYHVAAPVQYSAQPAAQAAPSSPNYYYVAQQAPNYQTPQKGITYA